MTQKELLMYKIMDSLYHNQAPIIFKGAMITKAILAENNYDGPHRETRDIDANWIGNPPSMETIVSTINMTLKTINPDLEAIAYREYKEKQSAGIIIKSKATDAEITSMDIDIKPIIESRNYWYGNTTFRGTTVNHILSDKISALSGTRIFNRAKDMIDIYALSQCVSINVQDIFNIGKNTGRTIGNFETFLSRPADMEHAYNKLQRVSDKPPFQEIYSYITKFIEPFTSNNNKDMVWDGTRQAWSKEITTKSFSGMEKWEKKIAQKTSALESKHLPHKEKNETELL